MKLSVDLEGRYIGYKSMSRKMITNRFTKDFLALHNHGLIRFSRKILDLMSKVAVNYVAYGFAITKFLFRDKGQALQKLSPYLHPENTYNSTAVI
jgi:hypothetical protein